MSNNGLTNSQINAIKIAFDHCDKKQSGKINVEALLDALNCLEYDSKSKILFSAIKVLDTESVRENGLSYDQLLESINNKLFSDSKVKHIQSQFNLLRNSEHEGTINNTRINEILKELSSYLPEEEINQIIKNTSKNQKEITLEDFIQKQIK
jgi:Ca2+-binding EF-hand superfamily protein